MDRRTTVKWMLAASAAWPAWRTGVAGQTAPGAALSQLPAAPGYGADPDLVTPHGRGEFWPLTLSAAQRRLAAVLSDLIIPADEHSPSASAAGVVDFIDEWVSAPYPTQQGDRPVVLEGFAWLDAQGARRSGKGFAELDAAAQTAICDSICDATRAAPERQDAARFFALYRDLTAAAFYSSSAGRKDLGYIGNVPLASFDGAPPELLKRLNLT
ncbi:MAG TPA: gluconate 2-dehydrogenase subunit 3 family protein [Steroidobacteraceae bacterium]|nr:gluconate 2-dehydrogenase subunit 3 family protein [Steroidobacteraceae bacterium]